MNERSIFVAALQKPSAPDRAAFLNEACGDDAPLRAQVETLLREHDRLGNFLEAPAADLLHERPGTIIGRYKLLEQIGEGGFGVVFMAEQQQPVRRKVALKIIKLGMDTRQVIARFEAERQALALMDHPNIAKVLDGGATDSGRPFFVMELIKGLPITEYCDQSQLTIRQRLDLFIAVCQAVQHAHQKGIIHRDIKPTNVLVTLHDGVPVVKVIDFGIAKATGQQLTEKTLFTNFAQMIGTPLYMSPEQASLSGLDVDTRSDIYSLGVLLYELLTGTTPFDKERLREANYDEIRRLIREEEPPKPSTRMSTVGQAGSTISAQRQSNPKQLCLLLRGELDWIVMKALEKDRNRRYETANGFAADVKRYLNDEPVLACPPSARYRLKKFVRRNKAFLSAVGMIAAALLLGTIVSLWQAFRATEQRVRAENNAEFAWQAVEDMYTQVAQKWLAQEPRMQEVQREFLLKALAFYEKFAEENRDNPKWRLETGKAHRRIGVIQLNLGEHGKAEAAQRRAIALLEEAPADQANSPDHRWELAKSLQGLALVLKDTGRPQEADDALGRSLILCEELTPASPKSAEYRMALVATLGTLADLHGDTGRVAEATQLYERSIAVLHELSRDFPHEPDHQDRLGLVHSNFGHELTDQGNFDRAEKMLRAALEILTRLSADFPFRPEFRDHRALARNNLGVLLYETDRAEAALIEFQEVVNERRRLAADHPSVPDYQALLASSLSNWAGASNAVHGAASLAEQEKAEKEALALQQDLDRRFAARTKYRDKLAAVHTNLGVTFERQARPKEAGDQYRQAIALLDTLAAEVPLVVSYRRDLAHAHYGLAELLQKTEPEQAEQTYRQALAVCGKLAADFPTAPAPHRTLARVKRQLCQLLSQRGERDQALSFLQEAVGHFEAALAVNPRQRGDRHELGNALIQMAPLLIKLKRAGDAEQAYRQSLGVREKLAAEWPEIPSYHHELGQILNELAINVRGRGELEEARQLAERAIHHQKRALRDQPERERYRLFLRNHYAVLADVLQQQGKLPAAAEARRELVLADQYLVQHFPKNQQYRKNLGGDGHVLGSLLKRLGKYREGLEIDLQTLKVAEDLARDFPDVPSYPRQVAFDQCELARFLSYGPERKLWDPPQALVLARKAVAFDAKSSLNRHALGAALYRNGNWQEAVAALEESVKLTGGADAFNGLFLAMACWKLEQKEKARAFLKNSEAWMQRAKQEIQRKKWDEDLRRLHTEALELMNQESGIRSQGSD